MIFRERNQASLEIIAYDPLIYIGPYQVYCIKPEGKSISHGTLKFQH